jgi:hypothetical protein
MGSRYCILHFPQTHHALRTTQMLIIETGPHCLPARWNPVTREWQSRAQKSSSCRRTSARPTDCRGFHSIEASGSRPQPRWGGPERCFTTKQHRTPRAGRASVPNRRCRRVVVVQTSASPIAGKTLIRYHCAHEFPDPQPVREGLWHRPGSPPDRQGPAPRGRQAPGGLPRGIHPR